MEMFKHFGMDLNNDTLSQLFEKMNDAGLENAKVTPQNEDGEPVGMFLLLNNVDAIPYIERALEQYDADTEEGKRA